MEKKILKFLKKDSSRPVSLREIILNLRVKPEERPLLKKDLRSLVKRGVLVKMKRGRYGLPEKMSLLTGVYQAHPDGYGFVLAEEGKDVFVGSRKNGGAMDGDMVVVRTESLGRNGGPEGRIIQVLERTHKEVIGRFEEGKRFGFVVPLNPRLVNDIFISKGDIGKACEGDIVLTTITAYPDEKRSPEGNIIEVLGKYGDPTLDMKVVVKNHGIPDSFSPASIHEAQMVCKEELSLGGRSDLREKVLFTIDGEDAKDFDDAVSIEMTEDGCYKLGVHIADVSHYVRPGSSLEADAYDRGTSVYFPGVVLPMLPFELSAGICSLKEAEDRLCLSVEIIFSKSGERKSYRFFNSIINSKKRFTYTAVKEIMDMETDELPHSSEIRVMESLAALLREKRMLRGSLDFDLPEPMFNTDVHGKILSIEKCERNDAHKLIEEFMLSANEATADLMVSESLPPIFRIHERPDEDKTSELLSFLKFLKYKSKHTSPKDPKTYSDPEGSVVQVMVLRSLKKACYSADNAGHFGLAMNNYTHFTSPIRRYPDLCVHRIIKAFLKQEKQLDKDKMHALSQHCSIRERAADNAVKDFEDLKRAEFMEKRVGENYSGTISGVKSYGFFVELDNIFVNGLVRVSTLSDDYYAFLDKELKLVGERTGKCFHMGMRVQVSVSGVDREKRHIDFKLL